MPWPLLVLLHGLAAQNSPLLSYQAMQELKERLSSQIVELETVRNPSANEDPNFIVPQVGQGVCVRLPGGQVWILASQFLVTNTRQIRGRSRAHPEWLSLQVAHTLSALGIVLLNPGRLRPHCTPTALAPGALFLRQPVAFTVDDPLGFGNVFWGVLDTRAEPPLQQFLVSPVGMPLSYPLFSLQGELLGLNLRAYVPTSKTALAASALQLRRALFSRAPWSTQRQERRSTDTL